jgi:drug/metabolite transporter (DMT)-like permease
MSTRLRVLTLTSVAIVAFAGNSVLTRLALTQPHISAVQFAGVRLVSGAVMLGLLGWRRPSQIVPRRADAIGVFALFVYAVAFTCAYLSLGAASGALVLFAAVQLTLAALALAHGRPPRSRELLGLLIAFSGLTWLLLPNAMSPAVGPTLLMALAGIAWGVYTINGRGARDPLASTARNFIGAATLGIVMMLVFPSMMPDSRDLALAIVSGMITSALGYVVWYSVLPQLNVSTAGAAQLLVPIVAAISGAVWLGETLTVQLAVVTALIVLGIGLTIGAPKHQA